MQPIIFAKSMAIQEDIHTLLEEKINRVIGIAEGLKAHNTLLQQQVDDLSATLVAKDQELEVLASKFQSLRLAKTLISSQEDVRKTKFQLSRMVREIDKCIALMNR